jgi:hypothetical protein
MCEAWNFPLMCLIGIRSSPALGSRRRQRKCYRAHSFRHDHPGFTMYVAISCDEVASFSGGCRICAAVRARDPSERAR